MNRQHRSTPTQGSYRALLALAVGSLAGGALPGSAPTETAPSPADAQQHDYAAAAVDLPAGVTAAHALSTWHALVQERGLEPDRVDLRENVVLGSWLVRTHVCVGWVRYHLALAPGKALKAVVVAECGGKGVALDRAAAGLADEVGQRLGAKESAAPWPTKDIPERLWRARLWRGSNVPPVAGGAPDGKR